MRRRAFIRALFGGIAATAINLRLARMPELEESEALIDLIEARLTDAEANMRKEFERAFLDAPRGFCVGGITEEAWDWHRASDGVAYSNIPKSHIKESSYA